MLVRWHTAPLAGPQCTTYRHHVVTASYGLPIRVVLPGRFRKRPSLIFRKRQRSEISHE